MKRIDHELYELWYSMRKRCLAEYDKDYKHYGAKGITICERWNEFWNFIEDVGPRPSKKHSIDRIDNSKGYTKDNVRWATRQEQALNRRIKYECVKGHPWTAETEMWAHNGRAKTRRCKICYKNRIKIKRKPKADGAGE